MAVFTAKTLLLHLSLALGSSAAGSSCNASLSSSYPAPSVADGWSYQIVANNFSRPRGLLFDSEGALIIVDSGVGLVRLELETGNDNCTSVKSRQVLVENEDLNHGIALSDNGQVLYASSAESVFSWPYDAASGRLRTDNARTLVTNMTNSGHTSRTLLLSTKKPNVLLVSRGSASNEDDDAAELGSGHSQLRAFDLGALDDDNNDDNGNPRSYDYLDGQLLGWGLRNSVGVAEHPQTGGIYSVENSVDNIRRKGRDIHTDNPAEELNFHGFLNSSEDRGNYGYPLCYTVWSTDNFPDLGDLQTGDQFPADHSLDDFHTLSDTDCRDNYVAPALAFQAHTAPLDIKFTKDGSEAFVSFHGSWNRDDPVGYEISQIAFDSSSGQPRTNSTSRNATNWILRNQDRSKCPDDCFRPVGLAWDSEDRLWFSSDSTGEIYVLQRNGNGSQGVGGDSGGDNGDGQSPGGSDGSAAVSQLLPPNTGALAVTFAAALVGFFLA